MNFIKKIKLYIVGITLFVLLSVTTGCSDDFVPPGPLEISQDTTGKSVIVFDSTFASYMNATMGKGSTFIYETIDGLLDTTIVIYSGEQWNIKIDENKAFGGYELGFACSMTTDYQLSLVVSPPYNDSSVLSYGHSLSFAVGTSHDFYLKNGVFIPIDKISFLDSVTIRGNTYYDVLINSDRGPWYEEIWYAKGIGIIMKKAWLLNQPYKEFYLIDYDIK
jgi:hypothetical protein